MGRGEKRETTNQRGKLYYDLSEVSTKLNTSCKKLKGSKETQKNSKAFPFIIFHRYFPLAIKREIVDER